MLGMVLLILLAVVVGSLILSYIQLRDRVELLESIVDRLDSERSSAAKT